MAQDRDLHVLRRVARPRARHDPGGGGVSGTGSTAPWGGDATCPVLRANRSFWHPSRPRGSSPAACSLRPPPSLRELPDGLLGYRSAECPRGFLSDRTSPMFAEIRFISRQPSFHPHHSCPCLVPLREVGVVSLSLSWAGGTAGGPTSLLILVAGGDATGVASTRFRRATR